MDEEAARREDIELLRSEYEKHLPILRETFISLLINGKLSQDDIEQKIKAYGMETLSGRTFLAGVVMTDGETEDEKAGFDVKEHRELIQFAVYNIANEIMETHHAGITFLYGDTVILISIGDDEESLVPKSLSVFYEIGESIKKYLKFTATIGAGYYCTSIQDIKRSYNSAVTACNYRMLLGGDKVIYIADIEPQGQYKASSEEDAVQSLVNSIRSASWPETSVQIDSIFTKAASRLFSPDEYMPYIFEIVTAVLRTANTLGISTPALLGSDIGQLIGLAGNSNLAEIKLWVKRICEKVINEVNEGRQSFKKNVIKDSKQYIREHYADPDAGIETVCRQMHISQSYFCSIFKKEMNDTFSNYLHVYRMQAAKELLRTTDLKLSDVAERIGYTDPNYFSFSFKKTFGISPREYRAL
jgi:two-component system response regulator YesN